MDDEYHIRQEDRGIALVIFSIFAGAGALILCIAAGTWIIERAC